MKYNRYSLQELVTIRYGKNQKQVLSDNGTVPIYGTGGLIGYATKSLYEKPSVLIGRKGTIQSAYAMPSEEKVSAESQPLSLTGDSFQKIIVQHDIRRRWYDESGILNINIMDFLLDESLV